MNSKILERVGYTLRHSNVWIVFCGPHSGVYPGWAQQFSLIWNGKVLGNVSSLSARNSENYIRIFDETYIIV